jgi:hypothetical protein
VLCRKSTDLSWDDEEPSAAAGEDGRSTEVEVSAPLAQTEAVAHAMEATPQEATMVEGTCTTLVLVLVDARSDYVCFLVTEAQVEGSTIPEVVAVETAAGGVGSTAPVAEVLEGAALGPGTQLAPEIVEGVHIEVLPESSLDVVVQSPEIHDAQPIRAAPMSEVATTSRDGLELLADDLVDPATVARNLEAMRRAEQWMKVCCSALSSRIL